MSEDQFTPKRQEIVYEDVIFKTIDHFTIKQPDNCPKAPTIRDFSIVKPISRGAFGKVFLGYKNNNPSQLFAIKVMRKMEMINKNMVSQVVTERNALALSRSPFCVNLLYSLQSPQYVYLVMEYMIGGDLKSLLAMYGFFEESAARFYAAEISLALEYLHRHGIVHRDIKPDNMLLASTGHVKLTDFGLSKIELTRELEISDLINGSPNPNWNARTPGQLLSLTSHLSFGSIERKSMKSDISNFREKISATSLNDSSTTKEHDDSKLSGVSPFFSAEDINVSITITSCKKTQAVEESGSSYYTCNSSIGTRSRSGSSSSSGSSNRLSTNLMRSCLNKRLSRNFTAQSNTSQTTSIEDKENFDSANFSTSKDSFTMNHKSEDFLKVIEDSGLTHSSNTTDDKSDGAICKSKDECNCSEHCCNISNFSTSTQAKFEMGSPLRSFKRPEFFRGLKRKRNLSSRVNNLSYELNASGSTGLTQEIEVMELGSSTPKKTKTGENGTPVKGVLKIRSPSDEEEMPVKTHLANVMFSTPVSSQKKGTLSKIKNTRFILPSSIEQMRKSVALRYKIQEESATMSPINTHKETVSSSSEKTPKNNSKTPYKTPKSVRRGEMGSDERILGTPDYLAPELLLMQGHGPAVDWWALGVCLYEFLTGVPPFNDETPQKVFKNILNRDIEWPQDEEALSTEAVEAVEQLLEMDPNKRPAAKEMQEMSYFSCIDWKNITEMEPPFVPAPDDPLDTCYFDARNAMQQIKLSQFDAEI